MILNPIAIATEGVYSNSPLIALATRGYVDLGAVEPTPESGITGGGFVGSSGFVQANNMLVTHIVIDIDILNTLALGGR